MGPPVLLAHLPDAQFLRDSDLAQTVHRHQAQAATRRATFSLAYVSLGVIFGDISTSPLYVFSATFQHEPTSDDILGVVSIIFWTITVFVLLKYIVVVLHATDHGEGGTFAMYSLLCRTVGVIPHTPWDKVPEEGGGDAPGDEVDGILPSLRNIIGARNGTHRGAPSSSSSLACWRSRWGTILRRWLRNTHSAQVTLMVVAITATAMLVGDGVLTPAISILSAVGGLEIGSSTVTKPEVVGISCCVVFLLFVVQSLGTHRLSRAMSPIVIVWLLSNLAINIYNLSKYGGGVFRSVSPWFIVKFFEHNGAQGWEMLGGTLLCMTGAEAMFAEMGHVSHSAISLSFCLLVYPTLVITYMGQASYLLQHPYHYKDVFWNSVPNGFFWPMIVIAIAAAMVASQAIITGCFSIIRQAMNLGLFPKLRVIHTSTKKEGQIYICMVNYTLMVLTIAGIAGFRDTNKLGTAYGLSVIIVMVLTTCLVPLVMLVVWELSPLVVLPWFAFYFSVETVYLSATLFKVPQGGWYTLAIAGVMTLVMLVWWGGNHIKMRKVQSHKLALNEVIQLDSTMAGDRLVLARSHHSLPLARPIGMGIYYNEGTETGVPAVMVHMLRNLHAVHQAVIILTVRVAPMPHLARAERIVVRPAGGGVRHFYQVVVRYGYMDRIDHGPEFVDALVHHIRRYLNRNHVVANIGRDDGLVATVHPLPLQAGSDAVSSADGSGHGAMAQVLVTKSYIQNVPSGGVGTEQRADPTESQDVQPLLNARHAAVVYYMGRHIIGTTKKGNLWHSLVCGPVYAAMELNSFSDVDAYMVPDGQLVDLNMRLHL